MSEFLDTILFLQKVPIFSGLTLDELNRIAQIAETDEYQEDEILFNQNDPGDFAYVIVSGEIEIFLRTEKGSTQPIKRLKAGSCFGEMSLLDGGKRSAGARVTADSILIRLGRLDFLPILKRFPNISLGIIGQLSSRLRETNSAYQTARHLLDTIRQTMSGTDIWSGQVKDEQI